MKSLILGIIMIAGLAQSSGEQQFTGTITDDMCPAGDHSGMRMGSDDAECTIACVEIHGAAYLLYDGKTAYKLSDQKTPEKFAGKKVVVTGTLDTKTKTIRVTAITAAK